MSNDTELLHASVIKRIWKKCKEENMDIVAFAWRIQREAERAAVSAAQPGAVGLTSKQRVMLAQAWTMLEDYAVMDRWVGNDSFADGAEASAHEIKLMLAPAPTEAKPEATQQASGEREAFEATYQKRFNPQDDWKARNEGGDYEHDELRFAWEGWQIARPINPTPAQQDGADMGGERCLWARNGNARCPVPAQQDAVDAEPKSLNAKIADQLRPFLKPGDKVIWREAFRWHDDNGVMPNHYDGMSIAGLADEFGYRFDWDFNMNHAAIIQGAALNASKEQP